MLYIIVGLLAGIISGLGIGGGTLMIPALTILWGIEQQSAQNMNLIYFVPTAVIALFTHAKNKNIETRVLPKLILFGFLGASTGSFIAIHMNADLLKKLFGGFLFVMGFIEFRKKEQQSNKKAEQKK